MSLTMDVTQQYVNILTSSWYETTTCLMWYGVSVFVYCVFPWLWRLHNRDFLNIPVPLHTTLSSYPQYWWLFTEKSHCLSILRKPRQSALQYRKDDIKVFGQNDRDIWSSLPFPSIYEALLMYLSFFFFVTNSNWVSRQLPLNKYQPINIFSADITVNVFIIFCVFICISPQ